MRTIFITLLLGKLIKTDSFNFKVNITAAIILTNPQLSMVISTNKTPKNMKNSYLDADNQTIWRENAIRRYEHGRHFAANFPIHILEWPSIIAEPCPVQARPGVIPLWYSFKRGNDRSVMMAHSQIWHNFAIEKRYNRNLTDKDIIIIFEDDVIAAVSNITWSLENEFSRIDADFVFLGWCYGKRKDVPLCLHAYAITRRCAKILFDNYDPCGNAIDEQVQTILTKFNRLKWRKARFRSYCHTTLHELTIFKETKGIFLQNKNLSSFNYHDWHINQTTTK